MRHLWLAALTCLLGAVWPQISMADTVMVYNADDSSVPVPIRGTLRWAISTVSPGGTIVFDTTVFGNGPGQVNIIQLTSQLLINKSLTLIGPVLPLTGGGPITIKGGAHIVGDIPFRVITVDFEDSIVTISNLAMTDGKAYYDGGGISIERGTLILNNCTVSGNRAMNGGGIKIGFTENTGLEHRASLTLNNCTVSDNQALGDTNLGPGTNLGMGGGIINNDSLTVINSTIAGNNAGCCGGGIYSYGGDVKINSSTIAANSVLTHAPALNGGGSGSGITYPTSIELVQITNSIVANNSPPPGDPGSDVRGRSTSGRSNLIGNTFGSTGWQTVGTLPDLTGVDPMLGPLQDNGGQTKTMALNLGSPAIDHGDNTIFGLGLAADQRGSARVVNLYPSAPGVGDGCDIGAYERRFDILILIANSVLDSGFGSMRQSIRDAIAGDTIRFEAGATGVLTLTSGELVIDKNLTIIGPGASNLTISGNQSSRVFHVNASGILDMYGLTLANGSVAGAIGAAGAVGGDAIGGNLLNEGAANLTDCAIANGRATGGRGGAGTPLSISGAAGGRGAGGGVYNSGALSLLRCTLSGDSAQGGGGGNAKAGSSGTGGAGGPAYGAGFANAGTATLTNCTLAAGSANAGSGGAGGNNFTGLGGDGGEGGTAHGAGFSSEAGSASFMSCTISGNSSVAGSGGGGGQGGALNGSPGSPGGENSGGLFSAGNVRVQSSIIAGNTSTIDPDVRGNCISTGYNLIGITNVASGFTNGINHDLCGTSASPLNALLGPLANYGGPTLTLALMAGSPAIDKGKSDEQALDQRGSARVVDDPSVTNAAGGDGSDIGAYEVDGNLRIIAFDRMGNDLKLSYPSVLGRTYQLEGRTDLLNSSSWHLLENLPGTGGVKERTLINALGMPDRFFRVRLTVP